MTIVDRKINTSLTGNYFGAGKIILSQIVKINLLLRRDSRNQRLIRIMGDQSLLVNVGNVEKKDILEGIVVPRWTNQVTI